MNVYILATCNNAILSRMSTLVFKTIKIGFPNACIVAYDNSGLCDVIANTDDIVKVNTIHHEWISSLLKEKTEPFWICDTDVIFYDNVEQFTTDKPLMGWRIPEWNDSFSGCTTRARLHTSLLYFNPVLIREKVKEYEDKVANTVFTPKINLINPCVLPFKGKSYFYDTCSLLYHAIGGQSFTDQQKDAYFHFNFGTISDIVLPRLNKEEAQKMLYAREQILNNPQSGKGMWREQEAYYANHRM